MRNRKSTEIKQVLVVIIIMLLIIFGPILWTNISFGDRLFHPVSCPSSSKLPVTPVTSNNLEQMAVLACLGYTSFTSSGIAFSPDGNWFAIADMSDGTFVYDAKTLSQVYKLNGSIEDGARSVAWSPDSNVLVSGGIDGKVRLWDIETGTQLHVLEDFNGAAWGISWSPDGDWLAVGNGNAWGGIQIVETNNWETIYQLPGGGIRGVRNVIWSPDSKWLAISDFNKNLSVWNEERDEVVYTQVVPGEGSIHSVVWLPDGTALTYDIASEVLIVDAENWQRLYTPEIHSVMSLAWSPDEVLLTAGDRNGDVQIWDTINDNIHVLRSDKSTVRCVAWSPNAKLLAACGSERLVIWGIPEE